MDARLRWLLAAPALLIIPAGFQPLAPAPPVSLAGYKNTGGRPEDANAAINHPAIYAWKIFLNIDQPGFDERSRHRGYALPGKGFDDPGPTIWQGWKHMGEVYLAGGERPGAFQDEPPNGCPTFELTEPMILALAAKGVSPAQIKDLITHPEKATQSEVYQKALRELLAKLPSDAAEEVRMNADTFKFILENGLYSLKGQGKYFATHDKMSFPQGSIEIKSQWLKLGPVNSVSTAVTARYHCTTEAGFVYGLIGLHIITKDLTDWFWCTFEHDDFSADESKDQVMPEIDPHNNREFTLAPGTAYAIPKMLKGTPWEHYRLRGTATSFNFSTGDQNNLDNGVIEELVADRSACMTCHARSRGDETGDTSVGDVAVVACTDDASLLCGPTGPPDPSIFVRPHARPYLQYDFVWSLARAQ